MKKYFVSFVMLAAGSISAQQGFSNKIVEYKVIETAEDLNLFQKTLLVEERKKQPNKEIIALCIPYYKEV